MTTDMQRNMIMIDIETFSTDHNASILSIGAVKFSLEKGIYDTFYQKITEESCHKFGLHFDPETIKWWSTQDSTILEDLKSGGIELDVALKQFSDWYGSDSYSVWCKGPHFDITIMENALKAVCVPYPWKYNDIRDYRTVELLHYTNYDVPNTALHNALEDAKHQAAHLLKIFRSLLPFE